MFRSLSKRYSFWKGICQPVWLTNSAGRPALPPALATCPPWTASGTRGRWLCRRWRHGSSPSTWSALCGWGSWGLLFLLTGKPTCCFTCLCCLLSFLPGIFFKCYLVLLILLFSPFYYSVVLFQVDLPCPFQFLYCFTCAGCSLSWWGPVPPYSSSAAGGANVYHLRRMPSVNPPLPVTGARVCAPAVLLCQLV